MQDSCKKPTIRAPCFWKLVRLSRLFLQTVHNKKEDTVRPLEELP
jgi:hypothetical protein